MKMMLESIGKNICGMLVRNLETPTLLKKKKMKLTLHPILKAL